MFLLTVEGRGATGLNFREGGENDCCNLLTYLTAKKVTGAFKMFFENFGFYPWLRAWWKS